MSAYGIFLLVFLLLSKFQSMVQIAYIYIYIYIYAKFIYLWPEDNKAVRYLLDIDHRHFLVHRQCDFLREIIHIALSNEKLGNFLEYEPRGHHIQVLSIEITETNNIISTNCSVLFVNSKSPLLTG